MKFGYLSVLIFALAVFLSSGGSLAASQTPDSVASSDDARIVHLLNRLSYGPAPGDIDAVRQMGIDTYIERQLHPELLQPDQYLQARLAGLPVLGATTQQLAEAYEPADEGKLNEEQKKAVNKHRAEILQQVSQAKLLRAIASPAQLQEVMTDFWFNHFNVYADKGLDHIFIGTYERDAIRPYALGKFRDLLQATAQHPAMIFYLDNWLNTDPNSPIARGKKIGINENYAREVMELHTLGVNGGYSQQDVTTLAHILTGWGLSAGRTPAEKANFLFDPRRHDFSNKTFLGYTVRGSGAAEIEQTLDMLARQPATAKHIAYELVQYFVADDPPQSLVDKVAAAFSSTGGDIVTTLRTLFHAPEFWDPHYAQNKFKPPLRYVASTFRALGTMPPGDTKALQGAIGQMGEPLYRCLTPNGYSAVNDQWMNSDALLKRIDFAQKLSGFLNAATANQIQNDLGANWTANTLQTVQQADAKTKATLLLSSPEFVYY